jgi:glucuronate isomerase
MLCPTSGSSPNFVGMVTDSRSFMSYPRHEYFRRVLCDLLGTDMERGEIPNDAEAVGTMIRNICFRNAKDYLGLQVAEVAAASGLGSLDPTG